MAWYDEGCWAPAERAAYNLSLAAMMEFLNGPIYNGPALKMNARGKLIPVHQSAAWHRLGLDRQCQFIVEHTILPEDYL